MQNIYGWAQLNFVVVFNSIKNIKLSKKKLKICCYREIKPGFEIESKVILKETK